MHILILPSWYPLTNDSFSGSFFREQALAYKKIYPNDTLGVVFQHFYSVKKPGKPIKKNYCDEGINTLIFSSYRVPKLARLHEKRVLSKTLKLFDLYVERYGTPDVIHVHSAYPAGIVALEIYKRFSIPYLITEHSTSFAKNLYPKRVLTILGDVFASAHKNIAVSCSFKSLLEKQFPYKFEAIANIASERFFYKSNSRKNNGDEYLFLNVGEIKEVKGGETLIKAFSDSFRENTSVKLIIVGNGAARRKQIKLGELLGIADQLIYLGDLPRDGVREVMHASADAFVSASYCETFGVVFVEALASGLPVIGTRCGGPENIILPQVGYLVEPKDIVALSNKLKQVYEGRIFWRGKKQEIQEYACSKFSAKVIMRRYNAIYLGATHANNFRNGQDEHRNKLFHYEGLIND